MGCGSTVTDETPPNIDDALRAEAADLEARTAALKAETDARELQRLAKLPPPPLDKHPISPQLAATDEAIADLHARRAQMHQGADDAATDTLAADAKLAGAVGHTPPAADVDPLERRLEHAQDVFDATRAAEQRSFEDLEATIERHMQGNPDLERALAAYRTAYGATEAANAELAATERAIEHRRDDGGNELGAEPEPPAPSAGPGGAELEPELEIHPEAPGMSASPAEVLDVSRDLRARDAQQLRAQAPEASEGAKAAAISMRTFPASSTAADRPRANVAGAARQPKARVLGKVLKKK